MTRKLTVLCRPSAESRESQLLVSIWALAQQPATAMIDMTATIDDRHRAIAMTAMIDVLRLVTATIATIDAHLLATVMTGITAVNRLVAMMIDMTDTGKNQ
mgnify:CR=1 FL=1